MGGRGSSLGKGNRPQTGSSASTSTPSGSTEDRIRDVVAELTAKNQGWAGIVDVRKALGDVDDAELTRALQEMARTNPHVHLAPEDNRKVLTDEDHAAAVTLGGEDQHIIRIEQPRDTAAKDRVQATGLGNATADDLAQALSDPLTSSQLYDQIRAEQKRRGLT